MSYYELATLDTVMGGAGEASGGIEAWAATGKGRLLGAFATDIGTLNRIFILRGFDSLTELMAERERALFSDNPFGCAEHVLKLSMESYKAMDFMAPLQAGIYGPVYEFRTYQTKLIGIAPTVEKWRDAVPAREAYSKLACAMYGLDGTPRITHIWPYESLAARSAARMQSVADGKWPPKGGPDWLKPEMTSEIALPLPFSPMQ